MNQAICAWPSQQKPQLHGHMEQIVIMKSKHDPSISCVYMKGAWNWPLQEIWLVKAKPFCRTIRQGLPPKVRYRLPFMIFVPLQYQSSGDVLAHQSSLIINVQSTFCSNEFPAIACSATATCTMWMNRYVLPLQYSTFCDFSSTIGVLSVIHVCRNIIIKFCVNYYPMFSGKIDSQICVHMLALILTWL